MSLEKLDALESKVRKLVDLVQGLKEQKASLEENLRLTQERLLKQEQFSENWEEERSQIRSRLEKVLGELDFLDGADESSGGTH